MTFTDKFAYAVEIARLRDGLQGDTEELRRSSSTEELERVLTEGNRRALTWLLTHEMRGQSAMISVETYNEEWAKAYLNQVEKGDKA